MTVLALLEKTGSRSRPGFSARSRGIDALRGLAVLLMLLDHALIVSGHPASPLRYTLTRLSMPLFFLISGHLARRVTWRHAWVGAVGLALPLAVPWIDAPNVLVWYAAGAVLVAYAPRWALLGLVALPLALSANFLLLAGWGTSYWPFSLVGLMAAGRLLPRPAFARFDRLPGWLGWPGRFPLSVYVGHLLALQGLVAALGLRVVH